VAFLPVQWQSLVERGKSVRAALSTGQLVSLVAVFVGVIGLLIGSTWYLNRTDYKVLFGDLDGEEAAAVVERLKSDNVDYQLQDGGRTILVAAESAPDLKLQFAGAGLPSSGRIGYEIFDKVTFGATEFVEQMNFRRALEGELGRTIGTISEVRSARVHITPAKQSLFGAREQVAKASVALTLRGSRPLSPQTTAAVTNLIAASVEGLTPDMVVIVDSQGRSLARGQAGKDDGALAGLEIETQQKFERELGMKVVHLLEPVAGVDRVKANVTVQLHAASIEEEKEVYSPETVLRSEQVTTEGSNASAAQGVPGARGNLPPAVAPNGMPVNDGSGPAATTMTERGLTRSSKVSNYEVSKTKTHTIQPRGEIERISVGVIVDDEHVTTTAPDGTVTTKRKPRDAAAMQKFQKLVATSLGIDPKRGDLVTVENMAFEAPVAEPVATPKWWQTVSEQSGTSGVVRGVAVIVLVALVLLLFVRPVVGRVLTVARVEQMVVGSAQQLPRSIEEIEGEIEAQLDSTPVEGDRRQPVLTRRVSTLANKEPESAAKLVRGWLTEGRS
jgi:flagellar M-ring protein FliF